MGNWLKWALWYKEHGINIVPGCSPEQPCGRDYCKPGKHPYVKWEEYQQRFSTDEELKAWDREKPKANLFAICGHISGNYVVFDIDAKKGGKEEWQKWLKENKIKRLPGSLQYETGGGGFHIGFRSPNPIATKGFPWGELKGEGGYVVTVPSLHASGKRYGGDVDWNTEPNNALSSIKDMPEDLIAAISKTKTAAYPIKESDAYEELIATDTPESRTGKLVSYAGRLEQLGLREDEIKDICYMMNATKFANPLSDSEFESEVAHAAPRWRAERTAKLVQIINSAEAARAKEEEEEIPKFPIEVITGRLKDYVDAFDPIREAPTEFIFLTMAQQMLAGCQEQLIIQDSFGEIISFQPKLYLMLIGESGRAKKSSTFKDSNEFAKSLIIGRGYLRQFSSSGSGEGILKRAETNSSMIVYADEFRSLLAKQRQDGNTFVNQILQLFDSSEAENLTKSGSQDPIQIYLQFATNVTLEDVRGSLPGAMRDSGFLNRTFFVLGKTGKVVPLKKELDMKTATGLRDKFYALLEKYGTRQQSRKPVTNELIKAGLSPKIQRSKESEVLYDKWYREAYGQMEPSSSTRLDHYLWTFEAIFAMSDLSNEITKTHTKNAIKTIDYQYKIRQWVWKQVREQDRNRAISKLRNIIMQHPGITENKLKHYAHMDESHTEFADACRGVVDSGCNIEKKEGAFWPTGVKI